MRVAIHTLGCKVNQYESQAMEELLRARGHSLVPFEAQADVYLINSCTVTATSDKKSRQAVRQARKRAAKSSGLTWDVVGRASARRSRA